MVAVCRRRTAFTRQSPVCGVRTGPEQGGHFPLCRRRRRRSQGCRARIPHFVLRRNWAYEVAVARDCTARAVWTAILEAGARYGSALWPDALNRLSIEKVTCTGDELNDNTSAEALGMASLLKKQGVFIGRRALSRALGLSARIDAVAEVRPLDPGQAAEHGAHCSDPDPASRASVLTVG